MPMHHINASGTIIAIAPFAWCPGAASFGLSRIGCAFGACPFHPQPSLHFSGWPNSTQVFVKTIESLSFALWLNSSVPSSLRHLHVLHSTIRVQMDSAFEEAKLQEFSVSASHLNGQAPANFFQWQRLGRVSQLKNFKMITADTALWHCHKRPMGQCIE